MMSIPYIITLVLSIICRLIPAKKYLKNTLKGLKSVIVNWTHHHKVQVYILDDL